MAQLAAICKIQLDQESTYVCFTFVFLLVFLFFLGGTFSVFWQHLQFPASQNNCKRCCFALWCLCECYLHKAKLFVHWCGKRLLAVATTPLLQTANLATSLRTIELISKRQMSPHNSLVLLRFHLHSEMSLLVAASLIASSQSERITGFVESSRLDKKCLYKCRKLKS